MRRGLRAYGARPGEIPQDVTRTVATLAGLPLSRDGSEIRVGGCGFDARHFVIDKVEDVLRREGEVGAFDMGRA
jgi:hypothetical protein